MTKAKAKTKPALPFSTPPLKQDYRLVAALILVLAFFAMVVASWREWRAPFSVSPVTATAIDLTDLRLELATTDAARIQGLSGRERLDPDAGMLFVFDEPGIYPFWMKDMKFPIDILWINGDRIVDIVTLPPPTTGAVVPPRHIPLKMADRVLELKAGEAEKRNLTIGSQILLSE